VLVSQPIRGWLAPAAHALPAAPAATQAATVTPVLTPCPMATPEPLWVQPVTSPTSALTQTIEIYAGNALTITVDSEAGRATKAGGSNWPARITINLLPDTTHHLTVKSYIARGVVNGCVYGGYTLQTTFDRYGKPLTIEQGGAATATPTASPTATPAASVTPMPSVTAWPCPMATPEPLWVQPVQSPTSALTQTIEIYAGRALTVTVDSEAGRATKAGGATWPARVTINLLPNTTHHLTVKSSIARTVVNGCAYGGYTLQTTFDRYGKPLTIEQGGAAPPTPTGTAAPTPTHGSPTATAAATETGPGSDRSPLHLPLLLR